jgi:hypothetical protein
MIAAIAYARVSSREQEREGMLVFLQRWAHDHDIRLKLFDPRPSVRDRLARVSSMREFDIATFNEMMALLARTDNRYARAA